MDVALEQWLNSAAGHEPLLDTVMIPLAQHGALLFAGLVAIWLVLAWWRGDAAERAGPLLALAAAALALAVNVEIALLWARPRPFVAHPLLVHLLVQHPADASFPSDHAAAGFAIATVLVAFHRRLGALVLVLAAVMSVARVYVGLHYPSDVLAGAVIGLVVGWLAVRLGRRLVTRGCALVAQGVSRWRERRLTNPRQP